MWVQTYLYKIDWICWGITVKWCGGLLRINEILPRDFTCIVQITALFHAITSHCFAHSEHLGVAVSNVVPGEMYNDVAECHIRAHSHTNAYTYTTHLLTQTHTYDTYICMYMHKKKDLYPTIKGTWDQNVKSSYAKMKLKCHLQIVGLRVTASVRQTNAKRYWLVLHYMVKRRNDVFKLKCIGREPD